MILRLIGVYGLLFANSTAIAMSMDSWSIRNDTRVYAGSGIFASSMLENSLKIGVNSKNLTVSLRNDFYAKENVRKISDKFYVDELYTKFRKRNVTVYIGRKKYTDGMALLYSPLDVWNTRTRKWLLFEDRLMESRGDDGLGVNVLMKNFSFLSFFDINKNLVLRSKYNFLSLNSDATLTIKRSSDNKYLMAYGFSKTIGNRTVIYYEGVGGQINAHAVGAQYTFDNDITVNVEYVKSPHSQNVFSYDSPKTSSVFVKIRGIRDYWNNKVDVNFLSSSLKKSSKTEIGVDYTVGDSTDRWNLYSRFLTTRNFKEFRMLIGIKYQF